MQLNREQLSFNSLSVQVNRRWEGPWRTLSKSTFLLKVLNIMQGCLGEAFCRTPKWPVEPSQGLPHYLLKRCFQLWQ